MSGSTDWLSAIGILLSGLVLGFMFIYTFRKNRTAAATADLDRRDLEAKRDALIRQLRELTDDEAEERTRLELEAAKVLRALESPLPAGEGGPKGRVRGEPATQTLKATKHQSGPLAGFLWGAGTVAALVFLGYYVFSKAEVKQDANQTMPMASAQGGGQQMPAQQQQPAQADPAVQKLEQEVSADPNNADKRIALARMYLEKENMMGVFEQTKAVLDKNPNDARAQTYNAIVRMAMGQLDQATSLLNTATKTDPKLADAWVALAWIHVQKGDKTGAKAAIDSAIENVPAEADRLRDVWTQMSNVQPAPAMTENPHAKGALADPAAAQMAPPAPAAAPDAIHLTLSLAPTAATKTGVLYIIARNPGETAGPPLAVKRVNITSFPMTVDFSSADSMMGQPLPKKIHLEARLDAAGDAATKSPTDPIATADGVSTGATLALTLK